MGYIDYSIEPKSDIAFVDMKSFYASVECVERGLNPLTTSLCVLSRDDHASGLILASSPVFKKVFGRDNVGRSYELPFDIQTRKFSFTNAIKQGLPTTRDYIQYVEYWAKQSYIVPPRMDLYIEKNIEIQKIFEDFASKDEIFPYSIDEGFLDLTTSLNYFVKDKTLSRKKKLDLVSERIQYAIWKKTGIYSTVGMSNANPLLAKLALDNEAKKSKIMRANWSYDDVESKVWNIPHLTDFWGIGTRTEKRLNKICINSIKELANCNPDILKKEFGVMGIQLWFHANGIDESNLSKPYRPKSTGVGNSQTLSRDYTDSRELEVLLRGFTKQVARRLRKRGKKTKRVSLNLVFSRHESKMPINVQSTIEPASDYKVLSEEIIALFRSKYKGGAIRRVGIRFDQLVDESFMVFSLFDDVEQLEREERLQQAIDSIQDKYGFTAILTADTLDPASSVLERSRLVGGHSAGGLEGLG
ncbi:Y-family DNA polymerase [Streptococcus suis]|uniref:Y-family DNA polymerase n=1 Tax=Streptococcus suis TaxID=1307 RepID=UPI00300F9A3D